MPTEYVLLTDDSCDLPTTYLEEHNIPYVQLSYIVDGESYKGTEIPVKEYYASMRDGKMPNTAQTNQQEFIDTFTPFLEEGKDLMYLAFSSGLSGTCGSAQSAGKELQELYPERKIVIIDSLCASLGQGFFVHKIREQRDAGATIEELQEYAEKLIPKLVHVFTVDDLMHLHRGGRVSKTAAIAGSLLGIKPHLAVDDAGKLIPVGKVRGRKAALIKIVDQMEELVGDTPNDFFTISHGDCIEDAEFVVELVKERFGISEYILNYIGPVIGSHAGPGTVALFMMGKQRML